jgi:hypothetical protein
MLLDEAEHFLTFCISVGEMEDEDEDEEEDDDKDDEDLVSLLEG